MPWMRIELDSDKQTARQIWELHRAGKQHRDSRDEAVDEVWRRGRTPAGRVTFVGITNGEPARLLYDVEIHSDTVR